MSVDDIISLLQAIGILLGVILSGTAAVIAALAKMKVSQLSHQVDEIHIATNSMKDELVKATSKASFAEGREAGRASQHERPAV